MFLAVIQKRFLAGQDLGLYSSCSLLQPSPEHQKVKRNYSYIMKTNKLIKVKAGTAYRASVLINKGMFYGMDYTYAIRHCCWLYY